MPTQQTLPSNHFLSLPPSYAHSSLPESSGTQSHASGGLAPNVASLAAADYDVDVRTGFLPATKNLERLPQDWDLWEDALAAARGETVNDGLRLKGPREKDRLWRQGVETVSEARATEADLSDADFRYSTSLPALATTRSLGVVILAPLLRPHYTAIRAHDRTPYSPVDSCPDRHGLQPARSATGRHLQRHGAL